MAARTLGRMSPMSAVSVYSTDRRRTILARTGTGRTCSPLRSALKADTGERFYQIVRHDLWDRDPRAAEFGTVVR